MTVPAYLRAALVATLLAAVLLVGRAPAPAAAASPTQAALVVAAAQRHLGAPYRWGAMGPIRFDCSGLVLRSFAEAGLLARLGGGRIRDSLSLYQAFAEQGLASTTGPRIGDLAVYGGGSHVGIYIGDGRVISALLRGVSVHGVRSLRIPFTTFLHTGLTGGGPGVGAGTAGLVGAAIRFATVRLNVRPGPSTLVARLTFVAPGTPLAVRGSVRGTDGRTWLKVKLPSGTLGWIDAALTR